MKNNIRGQRLNRFLIILNIALKKYASNGRVNYKGIQTEKSKLEEYLSSLSKVSNSEYNGFSKEQKIAFLINA